MTEPKHSPGFDAAATPEAVAQIHADIEACDRALDQLVSAIVVHDAAKPPVAGAIKLVPFSALLDIDRRRFDGLMKDPIRVALRDGLKRVAREIHRLGGGTGALLDSFEKVAELDPANYGRRASIMNSAFDGVGVGDDRWWS